MQSVDVFERKKFMGGWYKMFIISICKTEKFVGNSVILQGMCFDISWQYLNIMNANDHFFLPWLGKSDEMYSHHA